MKKALRFGVVFLCAVIFASLLFIAVRQTDKNYQEPKAPISVGFKPLSNLMEPTTLVVELPENHNADEVILYFGDELGKFDAPIGSYPVTDETVECELAGDIVCPENVTKIWVYTLNDHSISNSGYSMDLSYAAAPMALGDDDESESGSNVEKYAVIAIASALILSFIGYAWLGKKKSEDTADSENNKDKEEK